jgi:hypothetical protein
VRTLHRHRQHLCLPHHQAVNNANVPILPCTTTACSADCPRLTRHFWCRRIYALDAVGPIPEELWNLTALTNLYELETEICITFQPPTPSSLLIVSDSMLFQWFGAELLNRAFIVAHWGVDCHRVHVRFPTLIMISWD